MEARDAKASGLPLNPTLPLALIAVLGTKGNECQHISVAKKEATQRGHVRSRQLES